MLFFKNFLSQNWELKEKTVLQAMLMGTRQLLETTPPGIPTVIIMGDDTPSVPTTESRLDEPEEDDTLDSFRFSLGELDPDELAAVAAANAGFLHPLHNSGDAWRIFSQRVCDSDGEEEDDEHQASFHQDWTLPMPTSPPERQDDAVRRVHADVHFEKS